MPDRPYRRGGFTLVELIIAVAVLALLCGLALPSFSGLTRRLQADTLRLQLHAAMNRARTEAVVKRTLVGLCASSDGATCGGKWGHGWITFSAARASGDPASPDHILHVHHRSPTPALVARGNRRRVFFHPDGSSRTANLSVTICLQQSVHSKVIVNVGGRARSMRERRHRTC